MELGALASRPHALLGMELSPAEALAFDLTVIRAAKLHRATDTAADLQQMESSDEMGIGRIIALLFKRYVRG